MNSNPSFIFKNFIHVYYISIISAPFAPHPALSQIHDLFYTCLSNSALGFLILLREIGSQLKPFKSIYWSVITQLSRTKYYLLTINVKTANMDEWKTWCNSVLIEKGFIGLTYLWNKILMRAFLGPTSIPSQV